LGLPKPDYSLPLERYGNEKAGWNACLDGLTKCSTVYSFGVGQDVSFDLEVINRHQVTVHAFDPTPKSRSWVMQQHLDERFVFYPFGVGVEDGVVPFLPPENPDHTSYRMIQGSSALKVEEFPVKRLISIMNELGHATVDLIKMDIEGAEYAVLADMVVSAIAPKHLLVEFHHRFSQNGKRDTVNTMTLLKQHGYLLYWMSNSGEEFSFVRNTDQNN
jgi:FkbM family methyltransferase